MENFDEILGHISQQGSFVPNELSKIVESTWIRTPIVRSNVEIDLFQIMPNHFHAIVVIGSKGVMPDIVGFPNTDSPPAIFKSPVGTVGAIVRGFKGVSTKEMRIVTKNEAEKIWQTNYYERIIRDEDELKRIRRYIKNNPFKWQEDKEFFKKLLKKMKKK